jgi:mono/diheme cytochrome c family protein
MAKQNITILILFFVTQNLWANEADSTKISMGKNLFETNCASCHSFKQDGIGPQLGGITSKVSSEWITKFIKNPQLAVDLKDERALTQYKKFKTIMPSFDYLENDEIASLIAFITTKEAPKAITNTVASLDIIDPFPQKIALSDIVVKMELYTEIPFSGDNKLGTRIIKMDFQPETKENFILDLRGKLYQIKDKKPIEYFDISKQIPKFINVPGLATGFGSFAFHPDFMKNGLLYTSHSEAAGSVKADFKYADSIKVALQWVITEWKTDNPKAVPFVGIPREMLRVDMVNQIHGVQEIAFNPNVQPNNTDYGMLYIGVGDGGSAEAGYPFLPHNRKTIWGDILRIDPKGNNSNNGKYGIPPTNPFTHGDLRSKNNTYLGEIYAMGFRNPHRFSWTKSGKLLVANIGQRQIETVNLTLPGADFGWPLREGSFMVKPKGDINKIYALPKDDKKYNFSYPVIQLDHDEINAIAGGFEYLGNDLAALKGKYVFSSVLDGRLFYANEKDLIIGKNAEIKEWKVKLDENIVNFKALTHSNRADMRLGKDANGELYIFTKPDGKVYKLVK